MLVGEIRSKARPYPKQVQIASASHAGRSRFIACCVALLFFWMHDANAFDRNAFVSKPPNVIAPINGPAILGLVSRDGSRLSVFLADGFSLAAMCGMNQIMFSSLCCQPRFDNIRGVGVYSFSPALRLSAVCRWVTTKPPHSRGFFCARNTQKPAKWHRPNH